MLNSNLDGQQGIFNIRILFISIQVPLSKSSPFGQIKGEQREAMTQ